MYTIVHGFVFVIRADLSSSRPEMTQAAETTRLDPILSSRIYKNSDIDFVDCTGTEQP